MNIRTFPIAAALVLGTIATSALPSLAAPFFGAKSNFNQSCNTGYHTGYNGGFGYNTGIVPPHMMPYTNRFNNNINTAQARINSEIQRGIQSGRLTAAESARLMNAQNRIAQLEARLRVNGLSWQERQRLNTDLSKLQNQVRKQLSDRQLAYRGW